MDATRLQAWADALVRSGVPFKDKGRDRTGLDCFGVVRLAYLEVAGLELPSYVDRYADTADVAGMALVIEEERSRWTAVAPGAEQPGDVVLMRVDGEPVHVGIVLWPGDLLTALRGLGVWVESYRTMRWKDRVLGFYRPPLAGVTERDDLAQGQGDPRPGALVPVLVRPTPLSDARRALAVPVGTTLAQIVDRELSVALRPYAAVAVDGVLVPPGMLARVRPKAGHRVTLTCVPMNSGGSSGGGKNTGALVAMIGVLIIASILTYGVGPAAIGAALGASPAYAGLVGGLAITAGVVGATLAINALLPPPRPKLKELQGAAHVSPSITGTQNELRPFGVVPQILGRILHFPMFGGIPQREFVWPSDTYVREIFDLGQAPLRVSAMKIGATPLREFVGVDVKVHGIEVADDPTLSDLTDSPFQLYTNDMDPGDSQAINLSADLPEDPNGNTIGPWYTRRIRLGSNEALIDIAFPAGVGKLDKGQHRTITAEVRIDYQIAESGQWQVVGFPGNVMTVSTQALNPDGSLQFDLDTGAPVMIVTTVPIFDSTRGATFKFTDALWNQPLQFTFRQAGLDPTQVYEFRVRQEGIIGRGEQTTEAIQAQAWLVGLRSVRYMEPITVDGHATIELRIKASDQLSGVVDTFNLIAECLCPDWDANSQTWITRPTRNPASIARFILQGPANPEPADDDEIDLAQIQHWHEFCAANGFTFDHVVDYAGLEQSLLDDVCAAGRAARTLRDGWKFSVVIDEPQAVTRGHFSHRNAWGFSLEKTWVDLPHALRGQMLSEEAGWTVTDRVAFADGYSETNATRYEDFEQLIGVVNGDPAWKLMRYRLAELIGRPERYSFFVDFEHLLTIRGDRVSLAYDVIAVGLGSGRIRSLLTSGPNTTGVVLDEAMPMEAAKAYVLTVRTEGGLEQVHPVVTTPGETTSLTFQTPVATSSGPDVDDLVMFGLAGLATADVVIREIQEGPDDSAQIIAVPYMANFGDTGTIPPFDPKITKPLVGVARPPVPIIDGVVSDETALIRAADGSIDPQIILLCHVAPSPANLSAAYVVVEWRQTGTNGPPLKGQQVISGNSARFALSPVEEGVAYDLEVYTLALLGGVASARVVVSAHVVEGRKNPPPDVPELFIEDGVLTWPYPNAPIDLAGFLVRRHFGDRRTWSDAEPLHDGVITETHYPAKLKPLGVLTFLVKAIDSAAPPHEAANAAVLVVNTGGVPIENIIFTRDLKALGFPGTLQGGELVGDEIAALTQGGGKFWSGDDQRPFWSGSPGAAFWGDAFEAVDYRFSVLPGAQEVPSDLSIFPDATAESQQLKYRKSGTELFWSNDGALFWSADPGTPFWTSGTLGEESWLTWPGKLPGIKQEVHEFRLILAKGPVQGVIHGLAAVLDVPDRVEKLSMLAFPTAAAQRLPISAPFRAITDVQLAVLRDGGTAVNFHVVDYDPVNGPLVGLINGAGAFASGTAASGTIRGY